MRGEGLSIKALLTTGLTQQSRGIRASRDNGWKCYFLPKHLQSLVMSAADRELSTDLSRTRHYHLHL